MKYKSKIDWWIHLVLLLPSIMVIGFIAGYIVSGDIRHLLSVFTFLPFAVFITPIWLNTYYLLAESALLIKCGFFKAKEIPYWSIMSIKEVNNITGSTALSMDRLEVKYTERGYIKDYLISPRNKQEFLQEIKAKNESIAILVGDKKIAKANKTTGKVWGIIACGIIVFVVSLLIYGIARQ